MEEAERIAREEHGSSKIVVISGNEENDCMCNFYIKNPCLSNLGVGTRHYYRKLGYELDGPYMSKYL